MLNLDFSTFNAVISQAVCDAKDHPKWQNAIGRAVSELMSNPWIERQADHLLIGSPSGSVYAANGVCQCKAYTHGAKPCWHRAAARLVRLHDEREATRKLAMPEDGTPQPTRPTVAQMLAAARAKVQMDELFA